jgi:transcriptional repressor NrdR
MKCPKCGADRDKVVNSRPVAAGAAIRRRRLCLACGHRYTTREEPVALPLMVQKRDARLEPFDKLKLRRSIELAVVKRPVGLSQIDQLVDGIDEHLRADFEELVPSTEIGRRVLDALEPIDEVAYLRYASIFKRFRDAAQFTTEVENLIRRE